ncbi:hypothetical protein BGY98DRAFT_570358 [Russula aff. rugulosa BPL654]|nr:hypothetical protein BGY98DRAFT_570358 [Russula aff. rugulosa BPL654]
MLATVLLDRWLNLSRSVYVVPHSSPTAVAPFVHQVHCSPLTVLASFVFIVSTTYVWLAHPFTPDARIKVFFAQMVGLTNVTSAVSRPQLTHAITQLNVIEIYGGRLAATLSSSWSSIDDSESVHCIVCRGLTTCEWPVLLALLPSIASAKGGDKGKWLVANVTRLGPASLHVEIEGIQTRACTISVENYGIRRYRACTHQDGGTTGISAGAPTTWTTFEVPAEKEIRLLTLSGRVGGARSSMSNSMLIRILNKSRKLRAEYRACGMMGRGTDLCARRGTQVPARVVAISKAADGLVEAASGFLE